MSILAVDYVDLFGPTWGFIVKVLLGLTVMSGIAGRYFVTGKAGCGWAVIVFMAGVTIFSICIFPSAPFDKHAAWTSAMRHVEAVVGTDGAVDFGSQNPESAVQEISSNQYKVTGWVRITKRGHVRKENFSATITSEKGVIKLKEMSVASDNTPSP